MDPRTTSSKKKKKKEDYYGALHPLPPVVIPPLASGYRPESRRLRLPDVHQSSSDCRRGKLDTQWKEELNSDLENRSKMTSFPRLLVQSPISRDIAIYHLRKMVQERGSKGFLAQEMTGKDRFLPELPQKGNRPTQNLKVLQVKRPIELTWKQWKGTERAHLISMKGEFSETPQPVQSKKTPKSKKQREIILEDNLKDKLQERMDNLRGKHDTVKKEYLNEIFDAEKQEKSQKNDKDNRSVIKEDISTISADNIPSNFFGEMSTNSSSSTYLFRQLSDGEIKIVEDSLCGTITMVELNDLSESIVAWVVVSISRVLLPAISLYEERSRSLSQSSFQSQVHISTNEETLQATLSSHSLTRTGSHCSVQVQGKSSSFICGRSRTSTPFASPCSSLTSLENYAEEERGNDAPSHIKTGTPSPKLVDTEGREKIEADSSEPLKKLFGIPNSTIIKNADCIVQDVIGRALIEIQHPAPQEEPWHSHVRSLIPSSRSSNLASKILDDVLECVNSALSTSIQQNSTKRPANGVPDHLETQEVESTDSQVARRILQLVSEKLEPCFTDTVEAVTQEEMESELGIVASEIINAVLEEIKTVKDRQRVSELTPDVPQNREMVTSIGSSVTRSSSFQLVPLKHIETVEEVFPKQETEAKCFLTCDINPRSFESPVGTKRVLKENVMGISESEINNTPKKLVKREVRPVAKCLADRHKSESRGRATLLVSQVMMRAAAKLKSFNPSDFLETPVSITGEAALLTALDMPKHSQRTVSLGSSSFYLEVNAAASGLVDAILEKLQRAAATEKHKDTKEACNSDFPPEFETAVSSRQVHSVNEDVFKTVMTKLKHFFSQDTLIAFSAAKRSPDKQDKLDGPLKLFPTLKRVLPQTNSGEPYSFKESHLMQKSILPICPNASEHLGVLRDISSLRPILKSQDIQLMVKTCAQDIVCQLMQTIKSEMNRVETMRATLSEESLLASLQVDTIIIRIETIKVSELNLSLNAKESEKDRKADEEAVVRKKICSRQHVQTVNAPATVFPSHMGQVEYCSRNIPGQTPSSIFPKLPSRMSLVAKQGDTVASEIRQLSQALVWKELSTSPDLIKESPSNGTLREPERARAASVEEGDHSLTSPTCATPAGTIQAAISLSDIDFIAMKIVDRIVTRLELLACAEDQCNRATNKDTSECDVTPTSKSRAHESVGRIHKVSHGLQVPGATANVSLLQTGGPEERGCSNSSIAVAPTMNAAGKTLVGILTSSIPSLFSEELIDTVSKVISESSITKKSDNNPNSETADKNLKTSVFSIQFLILYAERSVRKLLELCLTFPGSQSRESEEHDVFDAPHVFNKKFYTVEQKMPGKESVMNSGHGLEKRNHSSQIHNDALDLLTRVLVQFVMKVLFASYDLPLEPNKSDSEGIARSVSVESTQETLEDKVILDRDTKRFSKGNVPGSDSSAHSLHTDEREIDGKLTQPTRGRPLLTYGVLPPIKERPRQGQPSSKNEPGQQTVGELQTEEGMSPGERPWNKKQEPPAKGIARSVSVESTQETLEDKVILDRDTKRFSKGKVPGSDSTTHSLHTEERKIDGKLTQTTRGRPLLTYGVLPAIKERPRQGQPSSKDEPGQQTVGELQTEEGMSPGERPWNKKQEPPAKGIARSVSVESIQETLEDKVILDRDTKRFSKGNVPGSDSTAHSLHTEEREIDGKLIQPTRGRPFETYKILPARKERPRQGQPSCKDEPGQQTVGELQTEEGMSPGERPWNKKQEPPAKGIARSVSVESTQETLEDKVILDHDTKRFSKGNVSGSDSTAHSLHKEERKIDGKLTRTTRGRPLLIYKVLPAIKERPRQGQPSSKDEPGQQTVGELQTEEGMSPGERPWNKKQEPPAKGIARSVSVESTQETLEDKVILDRDTKRFSKGNVPGSDSTAHSLHTEEREIDGKLIQPTRGRPFETYKILPARKERPRQGQPSCKDEPGQQTVGELQTEEGMSPGERPWNKKQEPPAKGEKPVRPPQLDNDNDNASANAKANDNNKAGDEAGASNGSVPLVSSAPCSDAFGVKRIISGLFEKIRPGFPREDTGELELVPDSQLTELTLKLTEHVMKKIVRIPSLASCNADEQEHLLLQHVKKTTRAVYRSMVEATGCKRDLQIAVGSRNPETMKRIICCVARHIQEGEFAQGTNSPLESLKPKDDSNRTTEKIRVMIPPRANKILPSPMNSSSDFPMEKVGGMKEMAYDRVSAGESFDLRNVSNEKRERFAPESSKKPKESIVPRELDVDEQHHAKAAKKKSLKAKKKRSLEAESSTSTSLRQPSEHEIKPLEANLMYAEFRHKEKGKKNLFRKMVNFGTRMKNRLQFKLRNDQNVPYYEAHMSSDAFERMPQAGPRGERKEQTSEAPRPGVNSGFLPLIPQKPQLTSAVMQSEPCHNASADRGNLLEIYEIQGTSSSFNSSGKRELMQLRDKNSIPQTVRKKIFEKESGPPERYQWSQPRSAMPGVSAPQPNPREKPPKSSVLTRVSAALARVFQKKK